MEAQTGQPNKGRAKDTSGTMDKCVKDCLDCYRVCLETISHCLEKGGKHAEAAHIATLMNCARICQTSAEFMISGSRHQNLICKTCAEVCKQCGEECSRMGDGMQNCVEACKKCSESCSGMPSH